MILDILYIVGFVVCGTLAPIFFLLGWKILKCPDSLWKEMQRTPYHKSHDVYERFWNN